MNALDSLPSALRYTHQALNLYRKANHPKGTAICMNYLGNVYDKLGDYEKSVGHYSHATRFVSKEPRLL